MQRSLVVLVLVCLWSSTAAAKGALVHIDFRQGPLRDILRVLADTGKVNIVPVGIGALALDTRYIDTPWDVVLADLVKRAGLASHREGSVIFVGDPATIAARKKIKRRAYRGAKVDLDVVDAGGPVLTALLSRLGKPVTLAGETRTVTQRLRHIPVDQATDVLAFAAGATVTPATPASPPPAAQGCQAADRPSNALRLAATSRVRTTRYAVLVEGTQAAVIRRGDCVGTERLGVRDVGDFYVTYDTADGEVTVLLHPRAAAPSPTP